MLAVVSYLVALQERQPLLTVITAFYALLAISLLPGPNSLIPTLVLFFAVAGVSVAIERRAGWRWALALYSSRLARRSFAAARVVPYDAGAVEALLLIFGTTIYTQAVLARQPLLAIAMPFYAMAAAIVQPDAHALLPLALLLATWVSWWGGAVAGAGPGRSTLARSLPPHYSIPGAERSGIRGYRACCLVLVAYLVAAVESRPDVLPLACLIGVLALTAGLGWGELPAWVAILAFVALGWLYALGGWLWRAIPWLQSTHARRLVDQWSSRSRPTGRIG